jgi:hypothetical protein
LGITSNLEYSRGYIAHWRGDSTADKIRYSTVFAVADQILKAGRIEPERSVDTTPPSQDFSQTSVG